MSKLDKLTPVQEQWSHRRAGNKLCRNCNRVKPLSDFYRKIRYTDRGTPTNQYSTGCKKCEVLRAQADRRRRLAR